MTEQTPVTTAEAPPSTRPDPAPRKLSREARRVQLIESTIKTLAARGYARTTLTDVANHAGLSHGLVNFHFQTKEKLLAETLEYLAEEYRENWMQALADAPDDPASRLDALLRADFRPPVCDPARLSAWCSFWGEAQSRPLYQDRCGSNDDRYIEMMEGICADLIRAGGYEGHPARTARVLRVLVEGVWLDLITMSNPYGRDEARRTVYAAAASFFPRHFTEDGLIGRPVADQP
jgi:TetR/AcrR family transcriptional repressor of bet genes